jgi:hypothetical protein
MTDSELILKYLNRQHGNDNTIIYLYVCGNVRSAQRAKSQLLSSLNDIFFPAIPENELKNVIHDFLEEKKMMYIKGQIEVKPFY